MKPFLNLISSFCLLIVFRLTISFPAMDTPNRIQHKYKRHNAFHERSSMNAEYDSKTRNEDDDSIKITNLKMKRNIPPQTNSLPSKNSSKLKLSSVGNEYSTTDTGYPKPTAPTVPELNIRSHKRKSIELEDVKSFNNNLPPVAIVKHSCVYSKHNSIGHSSSDAYNVEVDYDGNEYEIQDKERELTPVLTNGSITGIGQVQIEICEPQAEFCYAFWSEDPQGQINILSQGCWVTADFQKACGGGNECRSDLTRTHTDTKFCCCKTSLCNGMPLLSSASSNTVIPIIGDVSSASPASISNPVTGNGLLLSVMVALFAGVIIIVSTYIIYKYRKQDKQINSDDPSGSNTEAGGPGFSCSATCVDNLKLHDNIGSGRYAKVWRGSLGGMPVAVKALPASQAILWAREKDLYCLPHMRHPNLLQYLGCDTRPTLEGPPEHLLVLQLAPLGSLRSFLIDHTLDWDVYTNMALGIASALAHLHTHINKDGLYKPCIIHRDVNSSNIMVRADLSCCLGDLGLAMTLPDSKDNISQIHYRIQEAGSLRYLAPESLEGSLDLRRCAASLRAVDVYALSLVLWELLSRCSALHRAPGPSPYAPPFHAEVGEQPTLEKMQVVVAKRKARPLFSPRLLSVRATRLARDTCEDCWDHDAEARLTAVCVVERLIELKTMRPAQSPTINSNDLRPPTQNSDSTPNWHSPVSCEDKNSNITSSTTYNGNVSNLIDFQANILNKLPLQPHQGRNPCLERNLATVGQDDRLIDKSLKDMPSNSSSSSTNDYGSNNFIRTDQSTLEHNLRNMPQDFSRSEEQTIIRNSNRPFSNSFANQSINHEPILNGSNQDDQILNEFRQLTRPITPIGYVQNDVSGDVNGVVLPNTEGNPYGYPAKRSNILQEISQPKWGTKRLKKFLDSKMFKKKGLQHKPVPLETEVNLVLSNGKPINNGQLSTGNGKFKTSIIVNETKGKLNKEDHSIVRNEGSVDRPSSLPGLDSVGSNVTVSTNISSRESIHLEPNEENSSQINRNLLENNTFTISPPNQTISSNMLTKLNDVTGADNLVVGFKEFPSFDNDHCNDVSSNSKTTNQVFAVIVPKSYNSFPNNSNHKEISNVATQHQNNATLLQNNISERIQKIDNKLVKSDFVNKDENNENNTVSSKRFCDGKSIRSERSFESGNADDTLINKAFPSYSRNSYSGEFETGNFCTYNKENDPDNTNMMDYSSNSEDEHMLLLAENGGSKITMRQRYDIKSNQDSKTHKKNRQMSSSLSIQDSGSGLSKIAAESFSSLCSKYNPKSKYENLQNESFEAKCDSNQQQNSSRAKDSASLNRKNKKLSLSICRPSVDDENFIDLDEPIKTVDVDSNDSNKTTELCDKYDDLKNVDDNSLTDEVFLKKSPNAFRPLSIKQNLSRQHSLELVSELFSSSADLTRLKDPACRIKTPGDVPPSVRKVRGSLGASRIRRTGSAKESTKSTTNRLSLYDDRMMFGNSL